MYFKSFFYKPLAQMSYLIGCQQTGESIIIDPLREIDNYVKAAESEGLRITHAAETHIHADFASGLRDTNRKLGSRLFVSDMGGKDWSYDNMPDHTVFLKDGDTIEVGNVTLDVIYTPGHTPESLSFLLTDKGGGSSVPMGIFTGDFLFVGDVGRPDLLESAAEMEGTTDTGAKDMFHSVLKSKSLPDYLQIWPGHGAGSACGKSLGAVPMTTLGYEKKNNWAYQITDEDTFKTELTTDQPEPPSYFSQMKKINKQTIPTAEDSRVYPISKSEMSDLTIDLRPKEVYQAGHLKGTLNIPMNDKFSSYIGWFVDYENDLTFIGDKDDADEAAQQLQQIGFDKVNGYLPEEEIDPPVVSLSVEADEFLELNKNNDLSILDVRNKSEWDEGHLKNAKRVLFGNLLDEDIPFEKNEPVFVHCESGIRSAIALGALEKQGYTRIINIKGGYGALRGKQ